MSLESNKDDDDGGGSDWLNDSDEEDRTAADERSAKLGAMEARDSAKVEQRMYDEGYREGITSGKESMIQPGFDVGYAQKGAPAGRALGKLRGTMYALESIFKAIADKDDEQQELFARYRQLESKVFGLKMSDIVEQDWEAIEHAKEHGEDSGSLRRETVIEKAAREKLLDKLQEEADALCEAIL